MMTKESLYIDCIQASARPGADISDCVEDAVVLAIESKTDVEFTHNHSTFKASYEALVSLVKQKDSAKTLKRGD